MSEHILAAAREACAAHPWPDFPDPGEKNAANLALLIGLLDSTQAVAKAIYDNAIDDGIPINKQLATKLCAQSWNIARVVVESSEINESMPPI